MPSSRSAASRRPVAMLAGATVTLAGLAHAVAQDAAPPDVVAPRIVEMRAAPSFTWSSTLPTAVDGYQELSTMEFGGGFHIPQLLGVAEILRPDFRRRDLPILIEALELDADQVVVLETLIQDYVDAHTSLADACNDVIRRYRAIRRSQRFLEAIEGDGRAAGLDLGEGSHIVVLDSSAGGEAGGDAPVFIAQTIVLTPPEEAGEGQPGDDDEQEVDPAAAQALAAARESMLQEFDALTQRMLQRLERLQAEGASDASDVLAAATTLNDARTSLHAQLTELLTAIVNPAGALPDADAAVQRALDRVLVASRLPTGTLGGESIDLRAVAAAAGHPDGGSADVATRHESAIAALIRARSEAIIAREFAGLRALVKKDAILEETPEGESPDYTDILPSINRWVDHGLGEVNAHVAMRDYILAAVEGAADATAPDFFATWRAESMRRGFPRESRPRWAERAVTAALGLEGLTPEQLEAVGVIASDVNAAAEVLREETIAARIVSEPKQARSRWESAAERVTGGTSSGFFSEQADDGDRRTRQRELDTTTEARLTAALGETLMKELPRRNVRVIRFGDQEVELFMPEIEGALEGTGVDISIIGDVIDQAVSGAAGEVIRRRIGGGDGDGETNGDGG